MNREELIEDIKESLLRQVILSYTEQLNQLSVMLRGIEYLEDKNELISRVTRCEVSTSKQLKIRKTDIEGSKLLVYYEMPSFVLAAWSKETQLLRVTVTMKGLCAIPDIDQYDWHSKDFNNMNKAELLEHKSLVYMLETFYENVECDDLSFMD